MSSRALRRLQRERDTELFSVSPCPERKDDGTHQDETDDTADSVRDYDSVNKKTSSGPTNLFDLVITISCTFVIWLI